MNRDILGDSGARGYPHISLEERSEGFIDDIMDGIADPASDPLLALSTNAKKNMLSPN